MRVNVAIRVFKFHGVFYSYLHAYAHFYSIKNNGSFEYKRFATPFVVNLNLWYVINIKIHKRGVKLILSM